MIPIPVRSIAESSSGFTHTTCRKSIIGKGEGGGGRRKEGIYINAQSKKLDSCCLMPRLQEIRMKVLPHWNWASEIHEKLMSKFLVGEWNLCSSFDWPANDVFIKQFVIAMWAPVGLGVIQMQPFHSAQTWHSCIQMHQDNTGHQGFYLSEKQKTWVQWLEVYKVRWITPLSNDYFC